MLVDIVVDYDVRSVKEDDDKCPEYNPSLLHRVHLKTPIGVHPGEFVYGEEAVPSLLLCGAVFIFGTLISTTSTTVWYYPPPD
jgi:hypothetical protein